MLSVFLVEVLEKKQSVVSYFCTSEDERRNNASAVLRSLLWQVTRILPDLAQHILTLFGESDASRRMEASLSSVETLWMVFTTMCGDPRVSQLALILDGLDECDQESSDWLASKLCDLRAESTNSNSNSKHTHPPKIIIVSRDIRILRLCSKIRLDPDNDGKIGNDVGHFVAERVQTLWVVGGFDEKHKQRVETTILERSEGTFLWVGFAIAELQTKQTVLQVEESLADLPAGLPAFYGRMLRRIADRHTEAIAKILQWTALSARPLSLTELTEAIHCKATRLRSAEEVVRDLVTLCHPFLVLQSEAGSRETTSTEDIRSEREAYEAQREQVTDGRQTVNLIHQSARDFMDSSEMPAVFRFQHEKVHFELAWRCMDLIQESAREFTESWEMYLAFRLRREKVHLAMEERCHQLAQRHGGAGSTNLMLEYAVEHWSAHARKASSLGKLLLKHPSGFFDEPSMVRTWWYHQETQCNKGPRPPSVLDSITLSVYTRFVPWIEKVLTGRWLRQTALNKKTEWYYGSRTPLEYAADQGHAAEMRILLKHGATAGWCKEDPDRVPAIHEFAASGNEMAVRICIEDGTKLVAAGPTQETPLHHAAGSGHHAVVELLIAAGADCEAKDILQKTALMLAANGGYGEVVEVLLNFGAEVETMDRDGASALNFAAAARKYHVMTMLLDRGAPVDDAMALWLAARQGNEAEVRLLLDRGVPVDVKPPNCATALYCAALGDHNDVVQVLIERGAKIEAIAKASDFADGNTMLHFIIKHFRLFRDKEFGRVVQLFCNAGVDVNAVNDKGQTALHLAVKYTFPPKESGKQIRVLLRHGANINCEDEHGKTPLHHSVKRLFTATVTEYLLDHGAQVNARDHRGRTPLHVDDGTQYYGSDTKQLLLDHGADINARDNHGQTPLDYAYRMDGDINAHQLRSLRVARESRIGALGSSEHPKP
jgi:ankyrin repeat protein